MKPLAHTGKGFMMMMKNRRRTALKPVYPRKKKRFHQQLPLLHGRRSCSPPISELQAQQQQQQQQQPSMSPDEIELSGASNSSILCSIGNRGKQQQKKEVVSTRQILDEQDETQQQQQQQQQQEQEKKKDGVEHAHSLEACRKGPYLQLEETQGESNLLSSSIAAVSSPISNRFYPLLPSQTVCSDSTISFCSNLLTDQISCEHSTCDQPFHFPNSDSSALPSTSNLLYTPCLDYFHPNLLSSSLRSIPQSSDRRSELTSSYRTPLLLYFSDEDEESRSAEYSATVYSSAFSSPSLASWHANSEDNIPLPVDVDLQVRTVSRTFTNDASSFTSISSFGLLLASDGERQFYDEETQSILREREIRLPLLYGYIEEDTSGILQEHRQLIVNWQIQHAAKSYFRPETLFRAVNLMDRCLYQSPFKRESLPLLGMACMAIAAKLEETQPFCVMRDACNIGANCFTCRQLIWMEKLVLKILHYECSVPTTATFIGQYLTDFKGNLEFEAIAKYISYLSLTDYEILHFYPSTVAASCVLLACQIQKAAPPTTTMLEHWTGRAIDALTSCVKRLDLLHKQILQQSKL